MREIRNTTNRPIRILLPGGKVLHLNPGRIAQLSDRAILRAGVRRLAAEGLIEILGEGERQEGIAASTATAAGLGPGRARTMFHRRLGER